MSNEDPGDCIRSLARIAQAATRLMAAMHSAGRPVDREEELDHISANLAHVIRVVREAKR